jgi:hypothetical protein
MVSARVLVRELGRDYGPELTLSETHEMVARAREAIAQSHTNIRYSRVGVSLQQGSCAIARANGQN